MVGIVESGAFDDALRGVLRHNQAILDIMLPTLRAERAATYSPIMPVSPVTGRVLQVPVDVVDAALNELAAGRVDAVVYDEPLLRWTIAQQHGDRLRTLPLILERQDYALATPPGSELREALSRGVLERIAEPRWRQRLADFGSR